MVDSPPAPAPAKKSVNFPERSSDKKDAAKLRQDIDDEKLCKKIVEVLGRDGPQRVLVAGEAGIGKTRLAKMVGKHATKTDCCFQTICLHLNHKFDDEWSLYENIASQLSVYSDFEETEVDDRDEDEEDQKKAKDLLLDLKKNIINELKKKDKMLAKVEKEKAEKAKAEKAKEADNAKKIMEGANKKTPAEGDEKDTSNGYLLLILDDERKKTTEDKVMKDLQLEKFLKEQYFHKDDIRLKILVTRRNGDSEPKKSDEKTESHDRRSEQGSEEQDQATNASEIQSAGDRDNEEQAEHQPTGEAQVTEHDGKGVPPTGDESKESTKCYDEIKFHNTDMSKALIDSINEGKLNDLFEYLTTIDWNSEDAELISDILKKSKNSPAAIFVLAKSLNQITRNISNSGIMPELKEKIKEVLSADRSDPSDLSNPVLHLAYVLLETDGPSKDTNAILDCFWHSLDFFEQCGCVYYRDLITQWILEGYFDPVRSVEKAYQDGHFILMELINRGMLKIQENNVVVPEMTMSKLIDPRRRGHLGRSRLGFSRVYAGDKKKGIGKITQIDDMIKTVQAKKVDKITTILVSGDRLRRVTAEKYFKKLGDLEVLGLFEPTLEPFIKSFLDLVKLRVLVIRDCDLLDDIEQLKKLRKLNALEVSGASSLKKISDEFFKDLSELQSLHLSELKITSSPSSISELKELHCLIIRDCRLLEDLPDIQELVKLEVVDISGAHGLQTCFDNTKGEKKNKSKNKNFYHLENLQLLDFSESQIERLPIFQDSAKPEKLSKVTRLLLRDCSKLRRLPSLKPLSGLQILDLSGTTSLVEMLEVCFEDKKELRTLNLSRTNLSELATTIEELSHLNELLLKDCTNLDVIPNIQKLTNLEVIDVSGSIKLHKIEGSFEDMFYLRKVNLFDSKVTILPEFLPKESKIHCLKHITLADGREFEGKDWDEVKKAMSSATSQDASSSKAAINSQEISENKPKEVAESQPIEPRASDRTEKGDVSKERLLQVPIGKALYQTILSSFASASPQEVMEIHESKDVGGEALANAKYVSFVDISPTRFTSIFNETKAVKGCWLRMCIDIKVLFSGVTVEHLESLQTLSITNLPSLETISWGGSFKNLKNLSIDCCPNIVTIFPEASQMPSSLEVLHIKHCEKLEKVFKEEAEVSTITTLSLVGLPVLSAVGAKLPSLETFNKKNCPKLAAEKEVLKGEWVLVDQTEASA